jgi:voltage-gated potassium channel
MAEWPLMGTALVFLAAYAWQVIGHVEGRQADLMEGIMWITWAIFAADYAANLWLAPSPLSPQWATATSFPSRR